MWLSLDEEAILWPGGSKQKPSGLMIPTHLHVVTIAETPFVYFRRLTNSNNNNNNNNNHGQPQLQQQQLQGTTNTIGGNLGR